MSCEVTIDIAYLSASKIKKLLKKDSRFELKCNLCTARNDKGECLRIYYGTEGKTSIGLEDLAKQSEFKDNYSYISSFAYMPRINDEYGGYDPWAFIINSSITKYSDDCRFALRLLDNYHGKVFMQKEILVFNT